MSVWCIDRANLGKVEKLENGFLRVPARIARTGVQEYRRADGSVRRVLRPPEEVFNNDSMASFALLPFTDEHPAMGVVNADNATTLMRGTVGAPVKDGRFLAAQILVTDSATVAKIQNGKTEISCGYFADYEPAPKGSVWKDENGKETPYEWVQRNMRGNHVALVTQGRAGPEVRLQLDGVTEADIEITHDEERAVELPENKGTKMEKYTIDGVEFEVSPSVKSALEKAAASNAAALTALKTDSEKLAARADSAEAKVKQLDSELTDARDPAKVQAVVKARVALETAARTHLGEEVALDGLDTFGVKKAVLAKLKPEISLDGKSDAYVEALYDVASTEKKENSITQTVGAEIKGTVKNSVNDGLSPQARFEAKFFGKK